MLVSLADMKTYLNEVTTDYDSFLTEQLQLVSDTVEAYCRRSFEEKDYIQTFYRDDYPKISQIELFHYPVSTVTSIFSDADEVDVATYRLHKPSGSLNFKYGFPCGEEVEITYTAGYAAGQIPTPVVAAVKSLVEERYNRKKSGVALNFGADVQRVSIPGAISIDFDYTLNNNDRKNAFGLILGAQLNVLDYYRSERVIAGQGQIKYVEEV